MQTCDAVRDELALDPTTQDPQVQRHLQTCAACTAYRRRYNALDGVVRSEMRWQVPADLAASLLTIAMQPSVASQVVARPKTWHVVLAYTVMAVSLIFSLLIGWQAISLLVTQYGLSGQLTTLLALPEQMLGQLTQALPESRFVIDFFVRIRPQLLWLLLVAVIWAVLDKWNPTFSFRRQQRV